MATVKFKLLHDACNIRIIVTVEIISSFWEVVLSYKISQTFRIAGGTDVLCILVRGITDVSANVEVVVVFLNRSLNPVDPFFIELLYLVLTVHN